MAEPDTTSCVLCDTNPATTRRGAPVCRPCADSLEDLDASLADLEDADGAVAELRRRTEHATAAWVRAEQARRN